MRVGELGMCVRYIGPREALTGTGDPRDDLGDAIGGGGDDYLDDFVRSISIPNGSKTFLMRSRALNSRVSTTPS